jgi:hypothetical protein
MKTFASKRSCPRAPCHSLTEAAGSAHGTASVQPCQDGPLGPWGTGAMFRPCSPAPPPRTLIVLVNGGRQK